MPLSTVLKSAVPVCTVLACGCAPSVLDTYEAARTLSLSDPGAAPDGWTADATVQLSKTLLDDLMTQALTPPPAFTEDLSLGYAMLKPALTLETLKLGGSVTCPECVTIELTLGGNVGWTAPILGTGSAGLKVGCKLDAAFTVEPSEGGFAIGMAPRDIHDVSIEVMGARSALDISGPIVGWVESTVLSRFPTVPLTEIGTDTAPVRGIRISSQTTSVRIDLLTGARTPGTLPAVIPAPVDGFQVDVSVDSLLAIARTEAFRAGPLTYGILGEPTLLDFRNDGFTVGLRLWKTTGKGWWRDYEVDGNWVVSKGEIAMTANGKTRDMGHSRGAALADPLVAMGEGLIQHAIAGALNTTVPTRSGQLGTLSSELVVDGIGAVEGSLRIHGSLEKLGPQIKLYNNPH